MFLFPLCDNPDSSVHECDTNNYEMFMIILQEDME